MERALFIPSRCAAQEPASIRSQVTLAMRSLLTGFALGLLTTLAVAQAPDGSERSPSIDPRVMLDFAQFDPLVAAPQVPNELRAGADVDLHIVQFHATPTDEDRDAVRAAGGVIKGYLPHDCHIVYMPTGASELVDAVAQVRWVGAYEPAYRIEPFLLREYLSGVAVETRRYNMVMVDKRRDKVALAANIRQIGGRVVDTHLGGLLFTADLTGAQMLQAARLNEVLWIDRWSKRENDMNNGRAQSGANAIEAMAGYTGSGVRVHIYEGLEAGHQDFSTTPVNVLSGGETDRHGHCTAGIVFGNGTSTSSARGFAPSAVAFFTNYDTDTVSRNAVINNIVNTRNCMITTSSWGNALTGSYNSISADADDIVFDHRLPWTQSMSNWGTNVSVRPEAWAKNVISVGGVWHGNNANAGDDSWAWPGPGSAPYPSASIGPAADTRNKPDLSAYYEDIRTSDLTAGQPNWAGAVAPNVGGYTTNNWTSTFGGTSGATPMVAGMNALAVQMYTDHIFNNTPRVQGGSRFQNRPYAQTLKALMIAGADMYALTATNNRREHVGWGFPSLDGLYDRRDKIAIIPENVTITQGGTHTFQFEVVPGETSAKFCMTYLDPAGNPAASFDRVNNLDLRVVSPAGLSYWGNRGLEGAGQNNFSTNGGFSDTRDTVECAVFVNPIPGIWTAHITAPTLAQDAYVATSATDATYALVVNGARRVYGSGCARYIPDVSPSNSSGNYFPWGGYNPTTVTTTFASNNGGAVGGTVYFDLTVASPIYVHGLRVNTGIGAGTDIFCDVYRKTGSHVGFETSASSWTATTAGSGTAVAQDQESEIELARPFYLSVGTYGFAIVANNFGHRYTGTATTVGDSTVQIDAGAATNGAFGGSTVYTPRSANIMFRYRKTTDTGSNMRYQTILRSDELGASGAISGLAFSGQSSGRHFNTNLQVRMAHVPAGHQLSSSFGVNLPSSVLVLNSNNHSFNYADGLWREIGLQTSFNYNGTSDVVVDIIARGNVQTTTGSLNGLFHKSDHEPRVYNAVWSSTPSSGTVGSTSALRMRASFNCANASEHGASCGRLRGSHLGNGNRGSTFQFVVADAIPNSIAFIALGVDNSFPLPLSLTNFGWTNCQAFVSATVILGVPVGGSGLGLYGLPIPNTAALDGTKAYGQWLQLDPSEPGSITFSGYTRVIVGLTP
ncbi:MAG: serine protease AprX [Planctomycetota bacterium]|jgi:serine protease AprX